MDMKKILQTLDRGDSKPEVVGVNDMKRFVSVVRESQGPSNRLTQAESIAVYHSEPVQARKTITSPVLNAVVGAKPSMIGKYFKTVEQEFVEGADRTKNRARHLAERVSSKLEAANSAQQAAIAIAKKKKQGVAEAINMDIANAGFNHEQQIGDYLYKAKYWNGGLKIYAYDGAKKIGYAELMYTPMPSDKRELRQFAKDTHLESEWTEVDPKYQRQGIMSTMYAYAKMLGNSVRPSSVRSDDAKAAWKSWGTDKRYLTQGVAEGDSTMSRTAKGQEKYGNTVRNCVPK